MKKLLSFIFFSLFTTIVVAQLQHFDFNVTTPGTLKSLIAARGELYIFDMKVTGNIDARDIKCLRDNNPALAFLDLSEATINEYNGVGGTTSAQSYAANVLPEYSFYSYKGPSALVSIKLPTAITTINRGAFRGCTYLTDIAIPNSVTNIGKCAFFGCSAFKSINIPNFVTSIGDTAFYGCSALTSLIIPNSVTRIGNCAIANCKVLKDLTIGNSVSFMGDQAIVGCIKLETITFLGITPPEFERNRFFYLSSLYAIYVPENSVAAYRATKIADLFYRIIQKFIIYDNTDVISLTSGVKVYTSRSEIIIEGTAPRETVALYSITGKQLKTVVSSGEKLIIPVDKQGIYLVKIGGKTYKVVVK